MAKTGEGLTRTVNLPPAEEMDIRQFLRCNGYNRKVMISMSCAYRAHLGLTA